MQGEKCWGPCRLLDVLEGLCHRLVGKWCHSVVGGGGSRYQI